MTVPVRSFVFDSDDVPSHVERVRTALDTREESIDCVDAADSERDATLTIKEAVRIGSVPETLFDDDGRLDVSEGVLVTETESGRRSIHVGQEALEALGFDE